MFGNTTTASVGLNVSVDLSQYQFVRFWVRGLVSSWKQQDWQEAVGSLIAQLRGDPVDQKLMYQRCLLVCRNNKGKIFLKLFKDVRVDKLPVCAPGFKLPFTLPTAAYSQCQAGNAQV